MATANNIRAINFPRLSAQMTQCMKRTKDIRLYLLKIYLEPQGADQVQISLVANATNNKNGCHTNCQGVDNKLQNVITQMPTSDISHRNYHITKRKSETGTKHQAHTGKNGSIATIVHIGETHLQDRRDQL